MQTNLGSGRYEAHSRTIGHRQTLLNCFWKLTEFWKLQYCVWNTFAQKKHQKWQRIERIREENKRIKEWEDKFDQEQKIREDALIKKFYSDQSIDPSNNESLDENENDEKKNS